MPKPVETQVTTKTRRTVGVYLLLAVGLIVGTVVGVIYLFTGK